MRSQQTQLQDLADWIANINITPTPPLESFNEGAFRTAWRAILPDEPSDEDDANRRTRCLAYLHQALDRLPDGPRLLARIQATPTWTPKIPYRSLAELRGDLPPIEWLWHGWLPNRMLTLLAAKQGVGKSLLALDLAGRVLTGAPWPDGSPNPRPPAPVIYVDGENIPQVHSERARAWGLPDEHLYMLLPTEDDLLINLSTSERQDRLVQMVHRIEPGLVIVDSLGAVLGKGENAVEDVRGVLAFLASLALHYRTAVLAIHHLRKGMAGELDAGDIDLDQVRGSGHITAIARVAWSLKPVPTGPKPDPHAPRRLKVIKSNLGRHPDALGVTFEPIPDSEHVRIAYETHAPEPYHEPTQVDAARAWLMDYLREMGAPVAPKEIHAAAEAAGFSRSAVHRALLLAAGEVVQLKGRRTSDMRWALAAGPATFQCFNVSSVQDDQGASEG